MAKNTSVDEQSRFIWLCLENSNMQDLKVSTPTNTPFSAAHSHSPTHSPHSTIQIDFKAVGAQLGIKPHSAYCRWDTLKKKLKANPLGDAANAADNAANGDSAPGTPRTKRKRASPFKKDGIGGGGKKQSKKVKKEDVGKGAGDEEGEGVDDFKEEVDEGGLFCNGGGVSVPDFV